MITAAQRISPSRARLWLPFDCAFRQDVGANLLTNGDFTAGTTSWVAQNSVLSVVAGSPSGVGNTLQIVAGGGFGYARQDAVMTVGRWYRLAGWSRGVDAGAYSAAGDASLVFNFWTGPVSSVWAQYSRFGSVAAASPNVILVSGGGAKTAQFADFDLREAPLTTRNLGGMPGAPTYARMGDGQTTTTFPTQRTSSRGISLDGSDYVRVPMDFEYNEAFAISVLTDSIMPAASWLAATYDSATARGIRFGTTGSGALVAGMFDDGGRSITLTSANNVIPTPKQPRLYTLSYDGGLSAAGLTMWIDDQPVVAAGGGTALASSVSSGRDLLLGARWNAAAPAEILAASNVFCTSEYDTVLDAYELRMLKKRMMQEMRVGA